MKNWSVQICQFIGSLIGDDNYLNLIQNVMSKEECVMMIGALQESGKPKDTKSKISFKDYRLKRQTEIIENQIVQQQQQSQMSMEYISQGYVSNANLGFTSNQMEVMNQVSTPFTGSNVGYNVNNIHNGYY